ncbi:MAG: thioredoxin family protein [Alistipes sp.]|nr:thioredoxin family protein [Alistipes sp.]
MKRSFLTLLLLAGAFAAGAQTRFVNKTPLEVLREAREQNKLIFMDVHATWCGPCKTMDRYVFTEKEVGDFMDSLFVCVKVDVDSRDGKQIAGEYDVSSVPTFLVLTPDMELVGRSSGARSKYDFMQDMRTIVDKYRERTRKQ